MFVHRMQPATICRQPAAPFALNSSRASVEISTRKRERRSGRAKGRKANGKHPWNGGAAWRGSRCASAGTSPSTGRWTGARTSSARRPATSRPALSPPCSRCWPTSAQLLMADALAVRDGLYPPMDDDGSSPLRYLARVQQMFADLPEAYARRADKDATTGKVRAVRRRRARLLPPQNFHWQTDGYLSEHSADLYDLGRRAPVPRHRRRDAPPRSSRRSPRFLRERHGRRAGPPARRRVRHRPHLAPARRRAPGAGVPRRQSVGAVRPRPRAGSWPTSARPHRSRSRTPRTCPTPTPRSTSSPASTCSTSCRATRAAASPPR